MPNVVFFEIGVDDPDSAAAFYSSVFGWIIEVADDGSDSWYITTGDDDDPGIDGALTYRQDESNPTVNTMAVPSINDAARRVTEAGGKVLPPKIAIPGTGYLQYCYDLEGNMFSIMEYDDSAR
jgi:predicted enzyme related to lactoylglutathione lyase